MLLFILTKYLIFRNSFLRIIKMEAKRWKRMFNLLVIVNIISRLLLEWDSVVTQPYEL